MPFMIFENENYSYLILGILNNISGVSYWSTKKDFMTKEI